MASALAAITGSFTLMLVWFKSFKWVPCDIPLNKANFPSRQGHSGVHASPQTPRGPPCCLLVTVFENQFTEKQIKFAPFTWQTGGFLSTARTLLSFKEMSDCNCRLKAGVVCTDDLLDFKGPANSMAKLAMWKQLQAGVKGFCLLKTMLGIHETDQHYGGWKFRASLIVSINGFSAICLRLIWPWWRVKENSQRSGLVCNVETTPSRCEWVLPTKDNAWTTQNKWQRTEPRWISSLKAVK